MELFANVSVDATSAKRDGCCEGIGRGGLDFIGVDIGTKEILYQRQADKILAKPMIGQPSLGDGIHIYFQPCLVYHQTLSFTAIVSLADVALIEANYTSLNKSLFKRIAENKLFGFDSLSHWLNDVVIDK